MNIGFLTSTRRNFLRHCGLLATVTAAPPVFGGEKAPCLYSSTEPEWLREWNELCRRPVRESHRPLQLSLRVAQGLVESHRRTMATRARRRGRHTGDRASPDLGISASLFAGNQSKTGPSQTAALAG